MPRGGHRPGAGRPKGSKQVRSSAPLIRRAKAAGKPMPLDYLLDVMNDPEQGLRERLSAAIAAAPYVHPRLASVHVNAEIKDTTKLSNDLLKALSDLAEIARKRPAGSKDVSAEPLFLTRPMAD